MTVGHTTGHSAGHHPGRSHGTALASALAPLRERPFRRLFLAHGSSMSGDRFASVAIAFAVLEVTGSPADLGLVLAAHTTSLVLFLLAGGVWADRLPRHLVMVGADAVRAGTQAAAAVLLLGGWLELWQLVLLQVLHGMATAFFNPAATGLVRQTATDATLQRANALMRLVASLAGVLGPVAAGGLVAVAGPGWALLVDAASFALSAAFLLGLRGSVRRVAAVRTGFWGELAGGWREVRDRPWLLASIADMAVFQMVVLGCFSVLGPAVADRSFGGAGAWGLIVGSYGVGSILGGLLGLRVHPRRMLVWVFLASLAALPVLVALAVTAPLWLVAGTAGLTGLAISFAGILYDVALQQHVPQQALSRVSAYDWMGSTALRPVGLAAAGPAAAAVGVSAALLGGAGVVAISTLAVLTLPSVRRLARVGASFAAEPVLPAAEPVTSRAEPVASGAGPVPAAVGRGGAG